MSIEEQVTMGNVEKIAVIANGFAGEDSDKLKVDVLVKLVGERVAYQATYKVSRELLNPDKTILDNFFEEMRKCFRDVLEGKKELNAVI